MAYKVVVLGSSGVGKTSLVQRVTEKSFSAQIQSTVGVEFKTWLYPLGTGGEIKLNIWDTAGQERFRSVSKAYFRNAMGAILVFAIDSEASYTDLDSWLADLHQGATPNAAVLLVGNKADAATREITEEQAKEYCKRHELEYLETSAKEGTGVQEAFVRLAMKIQEKAERGEITVQAIPGPTATSLRPQEPPEAQCKC
jgi:small GTP-binding protein